MNTQFKASYDDSGRAQFVSGVGEGIIYDNVQFKASYDDSGRAQFVSGVGGRTTYQVEVVDSLNFSDINSGNISCNALAIDSLNLNANNSNIANIISELLGNISFSDINSGNLDTFSQCIDGLSFSEILNLIIRFSELASDIFKLGEATVQFKTKGRVIVTFSASKATITFSAS